MTGHIDLHIHTHYSDGNLSIKEIINIARKMGLKAIAFTDHDSVEAVVEFNKTFKRLPDLEIVPGVEITASHNNCDEVHLLGYGINPYDSSLNKGLSDIQNRKYVQSLKLIRMLNKYQIPITLNEIKSQGFAVNGFAIKQILKSKNLWEKSIDKYPEVFDKSGRILFKRDFLSVEKAIRLINQSGGKAFLAHPCTISSDMNCIETLINDFKEKGLWGIECYNSIYHSNPNYELIEIAQKYNLRICGGSDFHGTVKPNVSIGKGNGTLKIPYSILEDMDL